MWQRLKAQFCFSMLTHHKRTYNLVFQTISEGTLTLPDVFCRFRWTPRGCHREFQHHLPLLGSPDQLQPRPAAVAAGFPRQDGGQGWIPGGRSRPLCSMDGISSWTQRYQKLGQGPWKPGGCCVIATGRSQGRPRGTQDAYWCFFNPLLWLVSDFISFSTARWPPEI